MSSVEIINQSIKFHDPKGKLESKDFTFHFEESRPDGKVNKTSARLFPSKEKFSISRQSQGDVVEYKLDKGVASFSVNGNHEVHDTIIKKHRLDNARVQKIKDYYLYLWHLPLKLKDPGTIVHPENEIVDFFGQNLIQVKVSYSPEVGKDIWYFYFHPENYKLSGYRFYHDEKDNDGEYILIDGEIKMGSVRLPATRKWYTHKEKKFLGTDKLVKLEIN